MAAKKHNFPGIYCIKNKLNGKCYVGQAQDIEKRWYRHRRNYNVLTAKDYYKVLSFAFRKYGIKNFKFSVLEQCEIDQLNEREIYWIAELKSYGSTGYNATIGGDVFRSFNFTEEAKKKRFESKQKAVNQYSLDGNFIKQWPSMTEAANALNINKPDISKCCNNKGGSAGKFRWSFYGNELKIISTKLQNFKINQYDLDGNFIKEWDSIAKAAKDLNIFSISACCRGKQKSAGGFIWKYA